MKLIISFILIYLLFLSVAYSAIFPPNLKWKSATTDHFIIIFHQGEKNALKELIPIAEKAFFDLSIFWKGEVPKNKIYILLIDHVDYSNAITNIFPYNSITIYLKAPTGESFIGNYENWLKMVMYHELMHIFHLNHTKGLYKILQHIFGRHLFLYPHLYEPLWSIEGLATWSETNWTLRGRGRASDVNMLFRTASIYNELPNIDQITGPLIKFPGSNASYLYGFSFINYLSSEYPNINLYELYNSYSSSIIPFTFSSHIKKIYKMDLSVLWNEWQNKLHIQYPKQQINNNIKILLDRGYYIYQPVVSPSGKITYYSISDPHTFPKICKLNLDNLKENCFINRYGGIYLSQDNDSLLFSQLERNNSFSIYSDLYIYSISKNKIKRITYGLRARDASFADEEIIFIRDKQYSSDIQMINKNQLPCKKNNCNAKIIIKGELSTQFSGVKWNKEKKLAAVSQWQSPGAISIIIFDKNGNIIHRIGNDHYRFLAPSWTNDGEYLLFSADINGIFNIYSFSLKDKTICKITNEITGAFYPAISNSELIYVRFSIKGYQLASFPIAKKSFICNDTFIESAIETNNQIQTPQSSVNSNFKTNKYSPYPMLIPKYWSPMLFKKDNDIQTGFFTSANDLIYHSYTFALSYGLRSNEFLYEFHYNYDKFYPTFVISLEKDLNWYSDKDYYIKKTADFFIYIPYKKINYVTYSTIGILKENYIKKSYERNDNFQFRWLTLAYGVSNAKKYPYSISPTHGASFNIKYQNALNKNEINGSLNKLEFSLNVYLPLPLKHNVFAVKSAYGYSWGSSNYRSAYFIGGKEGDSDLLELRGYKTNSILASKAFLSNIEYHFPIVNIERGKGNIPVFIQKIHSAIFIDYAKARTFENKWLNKKSYGAEISIDLTLAYSLDTTFSIGYAKGINENGINQFYFLFHQYF